MHEIHTPPFPWTDRHGRGSPMQRPVFPPPHSHPQREALPTIPAPDPFAVDHPTFPPQEDPDSPVPEPGTGMRPISNAQSQGGLILRLTLPRPRRATNLGQATGPRTTHRETGWKPLGQCSTPGGPQTFFRKASDSLCVSSERSATSRFNRLLSSSSWRRRRSSRTPR